MIHTNGGRFGGYGLYLLKSNPVFVWSLLDLKRNGTPGSPEATQSINGQALPAPALSFGLRSTTASAL